jgi:hypothetical protein
MNEMHAHRRYLALGEETIEVEQQAGAELHQLRVVDEGRVHAANTEDGQAVFSGEVELGDLVEGLDISCEVGECFAQRMRSQPDVGERVGIADIDLGREVNAVAVVGKLSGSDVHQLGLRLPWDAPALAVDHSEVEAGLGKDAVDIPAVPTQVSDDRAWPH